MHLSEITERGSAFNDFANQFWFETLLHGNFVQKWCKENYRLSRCTHEYVVQVASPDLDFFFAMKTNVVKNATK